MYPTTTAIFRGPALDGLPPPLIWGYKGGKTPHGHGAKIMEFPHHRYSTVHVISHQAGSGDFGDPKFENKGRLEMF